MLAAVLVVDRSLIGVGQSWFLLLRKTKGFLMIADSLYDYSRC